MVGGKTNTNPIVKTFVKSNIEKLPPVIRKCPMEGVLEVKDVKLKSKAMAILPPAVYRISAKAYDKIDKDIMAVSILFKIDED